MTGNAELGERWQGALMNNYGAPLLPLVRGEGTTVWDADGTRYLDFVGGIATNALGHAHPAIVEAVSTQIGTLGHISNFFMAEPTVALAERLLRLFGRDGKVFFCNSGAEANEAAFKIGRLTGRTHIVATEGAFHGRTMGALALTGQPGKREPFLPLPGDVTHVPFGDAQALAAAVTEETALVIVEPIQGELGVVVPPAGYLKAARAITAANGALLVLDEVQTGIGRTGHWFEYQAHEGVLPTSSPSPSSSAAACRWARPSLSGGPRSCSSRASTGRRSAATPSPAPPGSPSSTPSRTRGCWRTSSGRARGCATESRASATS